MVRTMVRFENVGMRYSLGPEVLRDVTFVLEAGSFTFLTGLSGAGKTTLLKLINMTQPPSRGLVTLFGRDLSITKRSEYPALRRRIGVVFQEFRLIEHLSALDNVALPLRIAGQSEGRVQDHVIDLLNWVGLADHVHALPRQLSGGQQQRLAIARAVISQPSLLIADEPTGNVDDAIALRLLYLFEELNRRGTTVVIATHNQALIDRFGHPVLHIEGGRLERRRGSREIL